MSLSNTNRLLLDHLDEPERIIEWRRLRLVEAGFTNVDAALLATDVKVDIHRAEALLDSGASSDQIVRILL